MKKRSSQIDARFGSPRGGPAGARISRFNSPPDSVGLPIIRMINLEGVRSPERVGRAHFGPFSGSRPEGRPGHRPEGPSSQRRDTSATTRRRDHDDDDDEEEKNSKRPRGTHGATKVDTARNPFLKHLVSERPNSKRK